MYGNSCIFAQRGSVAILYCKGAGEAGGCGGAGSSRVSECACGGKSAGGAFERDGGKDCEDTGGGA
jgi:hypothetical protein